MHRNYRVDYKKLVTGELLEHLFRRIKRAWFEQFALDMSSIISVTVCSIYSLWQLSFSAGSSTASEICHARQSKLNWPYTSRPLKTVHSNSPSITVASNDYQHVGETTRTHSQLLICLDAEPKDPISIQLWKFSGEWPDRFRSSTSLTALFIEVLMSNSYVLSRLQRERNDQR